METEAAAVPTSEKPTVRIEQWRVGRLGGSGPKRIYGIAYGHPDPMFPDGTAIWTSEIVQSDYPNGLVETRNSIYTLGAQAPE